MEFAPVAAQPFPNCGDGNDQQYQNGDATAKVKPWTSKIILENYTLKRALPARLTLRKESCARGKELLPVGHELTGDFGALAHIRGQPLLISGYRIRRRTSRTQLLR